MSFEHLGLSDGILAVVADAGYSEPTPIQHQAIPSILMGRDILGIAQTGTGKTASFTLPMIDILSEGNAKARMPRSLILEPTRELAAQVSESFEKYGKNHSLTMALLIGGVAFGDQDKKLDRGVDVLIATPGRLMDHFERGKLMLNGVQILVVDEADRMLDMGFIPDVERICTMLPKTRQTLFFSATMPPAIKRLTDQFLDDPKLIEVTPEAAAAPTVVQSIIQVHPRSKLKTLRSLLEQKEVGTAIIFCNRKVEVKSVFPSLKKFGFNVGQLHGDMAQTERMAELARFRSGEMTILVASDVAARGLDIPEVSHVINYDVPMQAEDYIHRIGRTGRAGREGHAITIATRADEKYVAAIQKLIGGKIREAVAGGQAEQGGNAEKGKETPPQKEAAPAKSSKDMAADKKSAGKPDRQKKQRRSKSPADDVAAMADADNVVGMGGHVPAFLATPVGRASKK